MDNILLKRVCTIIPDVNPKDENGILNAFETNRTQLMKVNREKKLGEIVAKYDVFIKYSNEGIKKVLTSLQTNLLTLIQNRHKLSLICHL
ncbi:hypothetical protein [Bacillus thuringiensis]|uniref:hypothetical protein n=1 Tax=Bacillus thuringiensis TaxID=1428 RepID=UPI003F6D0BEE